MQEFDVFEKLQELTLYPDESPFSGKNKILARKIIAHKAWLRDIRRERPNTNTPYKVGAYIRYFNQTKYSNYLSYHKKQIKDTIELCPKWNLVDFYIDEGPRAPNIENAPELCRLLDDCMSGKIDLIITQKVSNMASKMSDLAFCCRVLAAQEHPVGIYFISEDIFTLASYYMEDLKDPYFLGVPKTDVIDEGIVEGRFDD